MKQFPSRLKFRKNHKSSYSNMKIYDHKNFFPMNGDFSLRAIKAGKINFKQIEACRKSIRRSLKKTGIVTVRVFTGFSETKKALGSRMGKGKGSHSI
jgi:large subunit ribosomal protein L16